MKKQFTLILFLFVSLLGFSQGKTTSAISGQVVDENGNALAGAIVKAVHLPSGSVFGAATQENGNYIIPSARVGGPYKITATYIGYDDLVVENVNLSLGSRYQQDFSFNTSGSSIEEVVVVGNMSYPGENNGVSTQITNEQIQNLPTLDRDLNDFTRLTPQASTATGGISFAGLNNRYNAVYIDGAVNNDVFGLADTGTNGGQIGISPISVDAIDQIQVVVSPYDVTLGGFAGGGINAVTRSGTNQLEGSAYYFIQNEGLAGKTNQKRADFLGVDRENLSNFTEKVYGLRLGGPIIKDKAFFFVNAEFQDNETPSEFALGGYRGNASQADLDQLSTFVQNNYNYNIGSFTNFGETLEGTKILGKFDFNINDKHKLTARHSYTKGELNGRGRTSGASDLRGANTRQFFPSTTNSSAIEWNFNSGNISNNFILGYTKVTDDRDPIGNPFPYVTIADGDGTIQFGSEQFSTANLLEQDIITITNNFNLYKGNHTLTFGTHNEFGKFNNIFIPQAFGVYEFSDLDAFYAGNANEFFRSYSIVDGEAVGDASVNAAAQFNTAQIGFYAQDEWIPHNNLSVSFGLRADIPFFTDDPATADDFNSVTRPMLINAGWDLEGAVGGKAPKARVMLSPRVGFNWTPEDIDDLTIKGGAGIFTSRIPFVWPGAMYSTNGTQQGGVFTDEELNGGPISFIGDVNNQYTQASFGGVDQGPAGDVNLFSEDFRFPQIFRTSLGFEKTVGDGWNVLVDGMFTKTLNNVVYKSVNFQNEYTSTTGPESRRIYTRDAVDSRYRSIYVGYNTNQGHTYNVSAGVNKQFNDNFFAGVTWSYGDAFALNEATSSQNSSQWRGQIHGAEGRNNPVFGRSDFSAGHRIVANGGYTFDWNEDKNVSTAVNFFYNGQSGTPFSWLVGGRSARNINNELGSASRNRSLFYIPATSDDIKLVDNGSLTAQEQWDLLNKFIEDDKYLSENRGKYAEKNSNRLPFESQLDVKVVQEFGLTFGENRHAFQFTVDIFNFGNLLNKEWGTQWTTNDEFAYQQILQFQGVDSNGQMTYTFDDTELGNDRFEPLDISSRWRAQLGLRYIFNR